MSKQRRNLVTDRNEQLARVYSERHYGLYDALEASTNPRSPQLLHDTAAEYLVADSHILDVGCRDAKHLIHLVKMSGGTGVGIDPLDWHLAQANEAVNTAGLSDRISIAKGVMEKLDYTDGEFAFVWIRDVLTVVEGLATGMTEVARVLAPNGHVLVYTNFATGLLEAHEADMINGPLGNVAASMVEANVEDAFAKAGLLVLRKDVIGTEWREYEEERDKPVSFDLLRLARLRSQRQAIVEHYGEELFELAQASLHWGPYQFLGKLQPVMYVLNKGKRRGLG